MTTTYIICMNGELYKQTVKYAKTGRKYTRGTYKKKNKILVNYELVGMTDEQCDDILKLIIEYKEKNNITLFKNIDPEIYIQSKKKDK